MTFDIVRARAGMRQISIEGAPRPALIEEAIAAIQRAPKKALQGRYLGIKNYAAFGDQREDHEYGFGPRHGTIVFSIGRTELARKADLSLTDDTIYLLEAYRDFPGLPIVNECTMGRRVTLYLCGAIRRYDGLTRDLELVERAFAALSVDETVIQGPRQ